MESLFSADYKWLWGLALAAVLFPFVRRIIWVMAVRKHMKKGGEENVDAEEQQRLKKRAGVTSAMLCLMFSLAYVQVLFKP
jgi:hypothetical protein